jgi:hypothetical protein
VALISKNGAGRRLSAPVFAPATIEGLGEPALEALISKNGAGRWLSAPGLASAILRGAWVSQPSRR